MQPACPSSARKQGHARRVWMTACTARWLILAATALGLGACGTMMPDRDLSKFSSNSADVDFGMSKVQVQQIMGAPRNRLYSGSQEAWQWCQTSNSAAQADLFLTAYFFNGRVSGVHTYVSRAEGICDNFFRRVEWLDDPEKAMAAKVRRRE